MTDIIKLAIVGAGLVGQRHINAIAKQKDVVLVAIVEPNPSEDIKAMDVPCFDTLEKMFLLISPDGVILSTPTPLHVSQGLECIEKGCPVLVEKPLATSAVQAKILTDAAEISGVSLLVGHHRRHNPLIQKAKELILDGAIEIFEHYRLLVGFINQMNILILHLGGQKKGQDQFQLI